MSGYRRPSCFRDYRLVPLLMVEAYCNATRKNRSSVEKRLANQGPRYSSRPKNASTPPLEERSSIG